MRVAFNQDSSCVVCGTPQGFRVYNCSPFGRFYASNESESGIQGVGLAEMLFSTSLVVITGSAENNIENTSPRQLAVVNTRRTGPQSLICELTFPTAVRALRLNRERLCVALDAQIYLYDISNMRLLGTLDGTYSGIMDLARSGNNWLAYAGATSTDAASAARAGASNSNSSGSSGYSDSFSTLPNTAGLSSANNSGDVIVYNMSTMTPLTVIHAHRSPLAALALNEDGSLLATSSDRGTLVRVFAVPSGTLLYEFRRGSYQSRVYSLAFSLSSQLLCVSSATQTVHIYKLDNSSDGTGASTTSTGDNKSTTKSKSKSKERWFSTGAPRDFAWFKLPLKHNVRTTLGIAPLSNTIYVASETGKLFHYIVDEHGGECRRIGEYTLE